MTSFDITFVSGRAEPDQARGRLAVGSHSEGFTSALGFWEERDYVTQWREGAERALSGQPSCLLTEVVGPSRSGHVLCYLLYPEGEVIFVQELLVTVDHLPPGFNPRAPYSIVPRRLTSNDEGTPILEWKTTPWALAAWLNGTRKLDT